MTEEDREQLKAVVRRHVPRSWRGDIRVEDAGHLAEENGRPAGTAYVDISARSKLGRRQAMSSIGPFVENAPGEWLHSWDRRDGRFHFRVYQPSPEPVQPDVMDAQANAEPSN
jgi:hypothetical protein